MSEETKTKPTEAPRIEKLSNYITELLQSIKKLGNDTPKEVLDAVEGAAKSIVIARPLVKHVFNYFFFFFNVYADYTANFSKIIVYLFNYSVVC